MQSWLKIAPLPLRISTLRYEEHEVAVSSSFTRLSTTVCLVDDSGLVGRGEDIAYSKQDQERFRARGPLHSVAGTWTLESFSEQLATLDLYDHQPEQAASHDYRRWAFESAALDLALRQAKTSLHEHLGRASRPLHFVVSMRLPEAKIDAIEELRTAYPGTRFKLDLEESWTREFARELHALDCIDTIDLKGMYEGTIVDLAPNASAYAMIAEEMPHVWIEDPRLSDATRAALAPHMDRVTWDAPMHSVADVDALEHEPRCLNCKPSRFGTLQRLFDFYDTCERRGIALYAGGQFELGVGRDQIQYLASIFHPDAPNDCAPRGYNVRPFAEDLTTSPLTTSVALGGLD